MEKNDKKGIIIGVLVAVIVILLGIVGYFLFIKKDNIYSIQEKLERIILNDVNKIITLNDREVNLKIIDNYLYVNDKKEDFQFEGTIFVTNNYVLIASVGQCGYSLKYGINENGELVKIINKIEIDDSDNIDYQVNDIRLSNNKIIANLPYSCFCFETDENKCNNDEMIVEFSYDGKNIQMIGKDINVKKNNTLGLKDTDGKDISINYEELESNLVNEIITMKSCNSCDNISYDNLDDIECSSKQLSKDTLNKVIHKLMEAKKVEYMPTSKICSLYTYSIDNKLVIFEGDNNTLLASINGVGYAFFFDENVVDFLKELI